MLIRNKFVRILVILLMIQAVWSIFVNIIGLHKSIDDEALIPCLLFLPPLSFLAIGIIFAKILESAVVVTLIRRVSRRLERGIDPEVAKYLKIVRSRPPVYRLSIEQLRKDIEGLREHYPPEPVKRVENISIPGPAGDIPARVYIPEGKGPFPLVVYYHGGGWCIGSLDSHDNICTALANRIPSIVLSVGYRLAPEDPFPAAIDDSYAALQFAARSAARLNADPDRIAVMGDSAGGNLAAAVAIKSGEENGPRIAFQALIYPATNLSRLTTESYRLFGNGYDLDRELIDIFMAYYIPDKRDRTDPRASPALAKDLKGLPRTLVITAEFDPLRDDGKEFADKLGRAGVQVKYSCYKGVIHGFLSFTTFHSAQRAFDEIASSFLNR